MKENTNMYFNITTIYCCALIVSNIIAARTFELFNFVLPSAVILFPIVYIINDVTTECFGFKKAKSMIFKAFVINIFAVIVFQIAINLPTTQDYTSFKEVLGTTYKALIASFLAYIIGGISNAWVMSKMKQINERLLLARCVISTMVGEFLDSCIFITIMFYNVLPVNVVISMIITQALAKTLYEVIAYPATKKIIKMIK